MRIKYILIVISFLSLFVTASGVENYETFDESYAEIRCGQLRNSFFPMRYDGENEKVYIGITALFYFLELYDVETDLDKLTVSYTVKGEKKKIKLDEREAFILDDELYVEMDSLKEKFDFRNITFDYSMLTLSLIPTFLLPNEERAQGKIDRLRFDAQKDEDTKDDYIIMGRKVLTPGFVKLNYYSYDFPKYDNLSYEYGNQFLYGSLYLNGNLKDGDIVNYGNLTYDDILGENDLVLGNIYMDKPHFINASSDVIGISLNNERTYFFRDSGMTIIKGEAEGAETVELYTGSFLLDYIHPTSKNFEFKISDGSMSDSYIMKIYYADGKYEERKVFSINDLNILQKGKNKINMQIGKESKTGHEQGNFVLYYGLTDNLTAGVGYGMLTSPSGKKFDFFRNKILYNSRHKIAPTLIEFKNYYEMNSNENNYNITLTQKYKKMQMKLAHEKYSEYIYNENSIKEYNSLLKIETKEVKFGKVAQGTDNNTPVDAGYIKIEGQANEKVIVQFTDGMKEEWKSNIREVKVSLKSGNEPTMLTYFPELRPELSQSLALNDNDNTMDLIGKLTVPQEAKPGDYEGTLKVKVRYE